MLEFFSNVHPLILDAVVVAVLVLIVFFGTIKGIKKTLIDFVILATSLFLGFCSYTNSLKETIADKVINADKLVPAGSTAAYTFGVSLCASLFVSLALFLLFYLLIHLIVMLFGIIVKKKRGGEIKAKSKVGRFFGAVLSLGYGTVITVVVLFAINNNIVGMKPLTEESTVTKLIVEKAEMLLDKFDEEDDWKDQIVLKVYKGDFLAEIDVDLIDAFAHLDEKAQKMLYDKSYIEELENSSLSNDLVREMVKEKIIDLHEVATIADALDDSNEELKNCFVDFSEETLKILNKKIKGSNLEKIEFPINKHGEIRLSLKNAGLNDALLALYDEITVGK